MTVPLGLPHGTVQVVSPDPRWPALFAAECARVEIVLRARGVELVLEHTGSTAVIAGKSAFVQGVLAHVRKRSSA